MARRALARATACGLLGLVVEKKKVGGRVTVVVMEVSPETDTGLEAVF